MIIGRQKEIEELKEALASDSSEFIAVYGRRRVGKTFLVREAFDYNFTFQHAGLAKSNMNKQLTAWKLSLKDAGLKVKSAPKSWLDAFDLLKELIRQSNDEKKVIFIDEMPWMDTKRSGFISALEHFWNGWASGRKDILLIVCGSATSWIINKVIKNHGGLYNRVTHKIHLRQFTLRECQEYAESRKLGMTRRQIMECYMIMGGVPFYWSFLDRKCSLAQNIDKIFFDDDAPLKGEFDELYSSLFNEPEEYIKVVTTLGHKRVGMTRKEIVEEGKITQNGKLTKIFENLEYCGFIRKYVQLGNKNKGAVFQLTDFYTLFYFKFILNNERSDRQFWTKSLGTNIHNTWCGLAFERVCLIHIDQIKMALGISGIQSSEASLYLPRKANDGQINRGAQIDLIIDRNDGILDICEMKYYSEEVSLDEEEETKIQNRINRVRQVVDDEEKAVQAILITTKGLHRNGYSDLIQNTVTMDALFEKVQ